MGRILPDRGLSTLYQKGHTSRQTSKPDNGAALLGHIRLAVSTLDDNKAIDTVVLDLRQLSEATDYFIVASGSSDVHVRALAEHVEGSLNQAGYKPHHVEGIKSGRWALLDYVDFVVHIFHPTMRQFYQLERLWADAPSVSGGSM